MPLIIDHKADQIPLYSWWRQSDGKVFVVIKYCGFDCVERIEILPYMQHKTIQVQIDLFLQLINTKKITQINQTT